MPGKTRFYYGYIIVIASFLIMMIFALQSSFGVFFKPISNELDWSRAIVSGAFSLCTIIGGAAGIGLGALTDRWGPRLTMTLCSLLSAAGYVLIWKTQTIWEFYLYYGVLIGVGSSVFPPLMSTAARWFYARRSLMTGIVFGGAGAGMLIFPIVSQALIAAFDWRLASVFLGIGVLIVAGTAAQFMKRDPAQIGLKPFGAGEVEESNISAGIQDLTLRQALRTRQFWLLFATLVCYGFVFFSIQVHIVPYATDRGISETDAAIILAVIGAAALAGQIGLGATGDRFGYKKSFFFGILVLVLATLALLLSSQLWAFYAVAIFAGLAFGNCSTQESPLIAWLFGLSSHGLIMGIFAFSFTIGASIGPVLFGYIFDSTGSYQIAFSACVVLSAIALILTLLINRTPVKVPAAQI